MKNIVLLFILFPFILSAQTPIKLTSIEQASDTGLTVLTKDTLGKKLQRYAQPRWLETVLPYRHINFNTEKHNLIFTNGNIFSWAGDTTNNWILQGFLQPSGDGSFQWGARNYLDGERNGMVGDNATGTRLQGYPALYLQNEEIQDSTLDDAYNYVPMVRAGQTRNGTVDFVREDSVNGLWLKPELENNNPVEITPDNNAYLRFLNIENSSSIYLDPNNVLEGEGLIKIIGNDSTETIRISAGQIDITSIGDINTQITPDGIEIEDLTTGNFLQLSKGSIDFYRFNPLLGQMLMDLEANTAVSNIAGQPANITSEATENHTIIRRGAKLDFSTTKIGSSTAELSLSLYNKDSIILPGYPSNRDDMSSIAQNIVSTSIVGVVETRPIQKVFPMFSAQNLNSGFTGASSLQNVGGLTQEINENTAVYSTTATTITFLAAGVYQVNMSGVILSSDVIAANNTYQVTFSSTGSLAPVIYEGQNNFPVNSINQVYFNQSYTIKVSANATITPRFLSNTATDAGTLGFTISITKVN